MKQETAFAAAFRAKGLTPHQMRAYATCAEFIEQGGTLDQWIEVYKLTAAKLPGVGHTGHASNGQRDAASARQSHANGTSHNGPADAARPAMPAPVRIPSVTQISANARVAKAVAVSAFDRERTHTDRMWGNVKYLELDSLTEDGTIAQAIKSHIGQVRGADRQKMIRDLMTPRAFAQLINRVRGGRHAA